MDLAEIEIIKADIEAPIEITNLYEFDQNIVINDFVVLKVEIISNSYDVSIPIPIRYDGVERGLLIFPKEKGEIDISTMTEFEFLAFLTVSQYEEYNTSKYKFTSNFLLVKADFFSEYLADFHNTSMLWGGFSHILTIGTPTSRYKKNITSIELGDKLKELDIYSYESCIRAIEQPYAFERFLKLYHLLELQFDYSIIEKIKNLSLPSDSNKIGKILNDYSINETQRLTDLIENCCTDITSLEQKLANVSSFGTIAEDMFINFGKTKNEALLINPTKFRLVVDSGSFSSANLQHLSIIKTPANHNKFITNLTSYWIYRIRCSIAHNKIGEYLLSWNDENFIVDFGEPLLKEVLFQYYKK